jgi:hypothetical protein
MQAGRTEPEAASSRSHRFGPFWIVLAFASGFALALWAAEIAVHWRNEEIHVSAPRLHFISGSSLERLKNGAAVPFDFQLLMWSDSKQTPLGRALERFVVSYDLWEEKFSVTKLRGSAGARENQSLSHLSANAAEAWCIDNISLPSPRLRGDQPFYVRLEVRSVDGRERPGLIGEAGISLTRLIEIFSHPARPEQQRWSYESGPLRLDDLKRTSRGS